MAAPTTPTTAQLATNIQSQIESSISQATPVLPKSFVRVLASAIAGVLVILYKYGNWTFRQMFPSTADYRSTTVLGLQFSPLIDGWGYMLGVGAPFTGVAAILEFTVTVTNQTGTLPVQTQIVNSSTGVIYLTTSAVALNASTITVNAVAASDPSGGNGTGVVGNATNGTVMQFVNPLSNVARNVTVSDTVTQGTNDESEAAYRDRVVSRLRSRPQGGAPVDYDVWGTIPGILNIYPYKGVPGVVSVYVEATAASSGNDDGIPTQAQLDEVYDAYQADDLGLATRRPIGALTNVYPISRTTFNVDISGLEVDDEVTVKEQIEETLQDIFSDAEPFIFGVTSLPRKDIISPTTAISAINDVVAANGGYFTSATVSIEGGASNIATYPLGEGEKAKLGTVSYSA